MMWRKRIPRPLTISVTLSVLAAAAVATYVVVRPGSDEAAPASGPAATETAPPSTTMTPTPIINATPITIGPDIDFPPDTMMLVVLGPYTQQEPYSVIRAYRLGHAAVVREVLFPKSGLTEQGYPDPAEASRPGRESLTGVAADFDGAPLFASVCLGDGCGRAPSDIVEPVTTVFYSSTDWGARWTEVASRDGEWSVRGVAGNNAVASLAGREAEFVLVPQGGSPLPIARGVQPGHRAYDWYGKYVFEEQTSQRLVVIQSGIAAFEPDLPKPYQLEEVLPLSPLGPTVAAFAEGSPQPYHAWVVPEPSSVQFIGVFDLAGGRPRSTFEIAGSVPTQLAAQLQPGRILGSFHISRPVTCNIQGALSGTAPAILDLNLATLRFMPTPFLDNCAGGSQEAIFGITEPLAKVTTPGDCLNLRSSPDTDSGVLTCLPDGVIVTLGRTSSEATSEGLWVKARAPDGQTGWLSHAYLELGWPGTTLPDAARLVLEQNLPEEPPRLAGLCTLEPAPSDSPEWCYSDVRMEGPILSLEVGRPASDHVFHVSVRRNADGSFFLISIVKATGL